MRDYDRLEKRERRYNAVGVYLRFTAVRFKIIHIVCRSFLSFFCTLHCVYRFFSLLFSSLLIGSLYLNLYLCAFRCVCTMLRSENEQATVTYAHTFLSIYDPRAHILIQIHYHSSYFNNAYVRTRNVYMHSYTCK